MHPFYISLVELLCFVWTKMVVRNSELFATNFYPFQIISWAVGNQALWKYTAVLYKFRTPKRSKYDSICPLAVLILNVGSSKTNIYSLCRGLRVQITGVSTFLYRIIEILARSVQITGCLLICILFLASQDPVCRTNFINLMGNNSIDISGIV